jgi:hypothetical protein
MGGVDAMSMPKVCFLTSEQGGVDVIMSMPKVCFLTSERGGMDMMHVPN